MSTLATDTITDRPGTGGPTLPNGLTIGSAPMPAVTGTAPIFACRAWVNFNGTGTVAIRASGNVSSITDNGVGDYTVNFTNAMVDANYSTVFTCSNSGATGFGFREWTAKAAGSVRVGTTNLSPVRVDQDEVNIAIFR